MDIEENVYLDLKKIIVIRKAILISIKIKLIKVIPLFPIKKVIKRVSIYL